MNESSLSTWEQRLRQTAESFPYPPTPNIAGAVRQRLARRTRPPASPRRLNWAIALLLLLAVLVGGILAVPQVRAAVLEALRVGAIRIFITEPTPTPTAGAAGMPTASFATPGLLPLETIVPAVAGQTTLADAAAKVPFTLRVPLYPSNLSLPDQVFVQRTPDTGVAWQAVIMVWLEPAQPEQARLSLYQIGINDYAFKRASVEAVQQTAVRGRPAFWVGGPHSLQLQDGRYEEWLFVPGNALIWAENGITYRLESGLSLDEAVKVAESLTSLSEVEEVKE